MSIALIQNNGAPLSWNHMRGDSIHIDSTLNFSRIQQSITFDPTTNIGPITITGPSWRLSVMLTNILPEGAVSGTITVINTSIKTGAILFYNINSYSALPSGYSDSFEGFPFPVISQITDHSCVVQIVNNGFNDMESGETFNMDFLSC